MEWQLLVPITLLLVGGQLQTFVGAACMNLAQKYCNTPSLSNCGSAVPDPPLVALRDGCATSSVKQWRCYNQKCLTPDHLHYRNGSGAAYCTRNEQISTILQTCKLPPTPPPPPYANSSHYLSEVFTPGELGYPCIRIPSVALAGDNKSLNAFAECRFFTGDGCEPVRLPPGYKPGSKRRDICQKRSTDAGLSWTPLRVIAHWGAQANPVYDDTSRTLFLQYVQLANQVEGTRGDSMQMSSTDHGASWTNPRSICAVSPGQPGLPKGVCGGAVGPGVGIRLRQGPKQGRLLFIAHYGAYGHDTVWFSDNNGRSYTASNSSTSRLGFMDEAQLVELPSGVVLANMRNKHHNATCECRGVSRSTDYGSSWSPVVYEPDLVSPVCMGTTLRSRFQGDNVYFANPDSTGNTSMPVSLLGDRDLCQSNDSLSCQSCDTCCYNLAFNWLLISFHILLLFRGSCSWCHSFERTWRK